MAPNAEAIMVKVYQRLRRNSVAHMEFVLDLTVWSSETPRSIWCAACNSNRVNTKAASIKFNLRSTIFRVLPQVIVFVDSSQWRARARARARESSVVEVDFGERRDVRCRREKILHD